MFGKKDQKTARSIARVDGDGAGPGTGKTGLGGDTKIKDWLAHPQGGPVLRAMLAEAGSDESQLKPVHNFAMKRLIPMSKGRFSAEIIAQLVMKAEAYDPSSAPAESAAPGATEGDATEDDIELPEFEEVITGGRFVG